LIYPLPKAPHNPDSTISKKVCNKRLVIALNLR